METDAVATSRMGSDPTRLGGHVCSDRAEREERPSGNHSAILTVVAALSEDVGMRSFAPVPVAERRR